MFILNDCHYDYKTQLTSLGLLPLSMALELNDIIFFLKSLQSPSASFNILDYVSFSTSSTRSASTLKLMHSFAANNSSFRFYFNRLPCLWNCIPPVEQNVSHLPYPKLSNFFGYTSPQNSTHLSHAHSTLYTLATNACQHPPGVTLFVSYVTSNLFNGCHDRVYD